MGKLRARHSRALIIRGSALVPSHVDEGRDALAGGLVCWLVYAVKRK